MVHDGTLYLSGCSPFHDFVFCAVSVNEITALDQGNSAFIVLGIRKVAES